MGWIRRLTDKPPNHRIIPPLPEIIQIRTRIILLRSQMIPALRAILYDSIRLLVEGGDRITGVIGFHDYVSDGVIMEILANPRR